MENKLITLAIHTKDKAAILKRALGYEGIHIEEEPIVAPHTNDVVAIRIRIAEQDLPRALYLVEGSELFENMQKNPLTDDGKKRILVPVDFSLYSFKACQLAFNLAAKIGAKVKIIHVYFNPFYPSSLPLSDVFAYQPQSEEETKDIIVRVQQEMKKLCTNIDNGIANGTLPMVNYSYVLREGVAEDEIISFSKEYQPYLIVMGTRGKHHKDVDLIGSVAAEVLEASRIPVIALPENTHIDDLEKVKRIAFFTNFTQRDILAFDTLLKPFQEQNLSVYITHIATKRDPLDKVKIQGFVAYLKEIYPHIEFDYGILDGKDFSEDLERYIRSKQIDMLAITTSRRNIFARMFNPSIARKMLFHSDTALFVLRQPRKE